MTRASDNIFPRLLISEGGSTATPASGEVTVYAKSDGLLYSKDDAGAETALGAAGAGNTIIIKDEGGALATAADTLDFVGDGVVASGTGTTKTITIPGGGGGATNTTWSVPPGGILPTPTQNNAAASPKLLCRATASVTSTFAVTKGSNFYFKAVKNGTTVETILVTASGTVTPAAINVVNGDMVWFLMDGYGTIDTGTITISAGAFDIPTWTLDATVSPSGGGAVWITPEVTVEESGYATAVFYCDSSGGAFYSFLYKNGSSLQTLTISGAALYFFPKIRVVRGDRLQVKYSSGGGGNYYSGAILLNVPYGDVILTPTVRAAAGVPSGAPTGSELPLAADTTASTGGLYFWTGAAWTKIATIP